MEKIHGLIDAPFTPFHADGSLNTEPIAGYAALLARNGLQGVFINGSSGEICDQYAAKDSRVRVIHQKNGGAAAAKNAGLCLLLGGEQPGFLLQRDGLAGGGGL